MLMLLVGHLFLITLIVISIDELSAETDDLKTCSTPDCFWINFELSEKVNKKADPCQDFYEFACGKNKNRGTPLEISVDLMKNDIYQALEKPNDEKDSPSWNLAKDMYRVCTNHDSNVDDLRKFIDDIGGWAVLNSKWNESAFSLEKFFTKSIQWGYNHNSLFTIDHIANPKNSTQKILRIMEANAESFDNIFPTTINMEPIYMRPSDQFQKQYIKKLVSMLKMDESKAEESFDTYDSMREKLFGVYAKSLANQTTTMGQMIGSYCNIPWASILKAYLQPVVIYMYEPVIIDCTNCIAALNELIGNSTKRELADYLMWSLVIKTGLEIDNNNFRPSFPPDVLASKARYCAILTTYRFRRAIDYHYVQTQVNATSELMEYVMHIKEQMKDTIMKDTRLDNETKGNAIEKMNNMKIKLHADEDITTQKQVDAYYDRLIGNTNPKSYFRALLNLTKFYIWKDLVSLRKPHKVYLEATSSTPTSYLYFYNTVLIAASFTRTRSFLPERKPKYLNFPIIGFPFAKTMSHTFDPRGSRYDAYGNSANWWKPETKAQFDETYSCFEKQYSQFINKETGHKVNGLFTLDSNVADNSGIYIAYKAYRNIKLESPEPDLDEFRAYSPRQMFWIAAAYPFCSKSTKEDVLYREQYSLTAENPVRVNGMMMNSEEFAKDFQCAAKTPMNPEKKCKLWQ